MSKRVRFYVALVIDVLLACALTAVANAGDWSKAELYGVGAGVMIVFCLIVMPWLEMAPDGAWRQRPHG